MSKKSVLIADDSEKLLSALREELQVHGYDVRTCTDAYTVLESAQKQRPDVMMLDIRMPAGNGFSVLERMRKTPELQNIPVIYITGEKSAEVDLKAEQLGARGVIHKPIVLSKLLKLIEAAIGDNDQNASELSEGSELKEFDVSSDAEAPDFLRAP
ncbi:MAG TPA: response regulator [Tepidisphaeraceae bacterium]|nr:response regulator [Tepidisphaeraceae bacterium]